VKPIWLTQTTARQILERPDGYSNISLNLGISTAGVRKEYKNLYIGDNIISLNSVERIASERAGIYILDLETESMKLLSGSHEGVYYALIPTNTAPTIMISGIQMHKRDDPWDDAMRKVKSVIRAGDWVFDTCGGLSYTSQNCLFQGAAVVVSSEPNPYVRQLRHSNPWSGRWSSEGLIDHAIKAQSLIKEIGTRSMDCVIHDPPRFSLAGELYGARFYSSLHRILRKGGRLFHYTGVPYEKRRGKSFVYGVARRLSEAGFATTWDDSTKGFICRAK